MTAEDAKGRKKLAGYMLRAPMSLEKMTYDAAAGTVIYRSKMDVGPKRNFQLMPGAERLAPRAMQTKSAIYGSRGLAAARQPAAHPPPSFRHRLNAGRRAPCLPWRARGLQSLQRCIGTGRRQQAR